MSEKNGNIEYTYTFSFSEGTVKEFTVTLDRSELVLIQKEPENIPDWALLTNRQCPNCPLSPAEYKYCPIAKNIGSLVEIFSDFASYQEADVVINTPNRTYSQTTSLQKGLSSLLGIYMVTTGCPVMEKLKPMVKFHLPFATGEETTYRVISMYLLGQYFRHRRGEPGDWDLKKLGKIYNEVQEVNMCFSDRLREAIKKDAGINALIILDNFANYVLYELDDRMMVELEKQFLRFSLDE